ncbi:hypothetical protein B0H14DRAFT_2724785 [Mycena olivaceomarginata]|nr:hypothetical protein B0H14DRAFT_2724785 [Mycena olivaceomarginata]
MSWSSVSCWSWGESESLSSSSKSPKVLEGEGEETLDLGGLGEGRAVEGILIDVTATEWEEWIVLRSSSKLDSSSGRGELLAVDSVSAGAGSSTKDKYGKSVTSPRSMVDALRGCGIPCKLALSPSPVVLGKSHSMSRSEGVERLPLKAREAE